MSQVIENRVVELDFNNANFEKGVQTSLNTLNQLNKKFDLAGAGKNLQDFGKSTSSLNLTPLISAVETVADRFSTLRFVGLKVLGNIVDAAMQAGGKIVSALATPLNQIKEGGLTRALNIEQASFLLEGLGLDVKQVKEDALYAVKGTAFGFDEAAKVAASFGASGVAAGDDMKKALLGVSGVAAMTGKSYEDIGNIFTTVASNGKLMTMQLRQFSAAGLNVSAALAKSLGKTEEEINDMVSKGQISFEEFSRVMTESFGEHAKKANDTYAGSLSNLKAALSRIGADVQGPRLEHMRDIFNSLTTVVDNLHDSLGPIIKDINNFMAKGAKLLLDFINGFDRLGIGQNIITGLRNVFWSLMLVLKPITEAFKQVFPKSLLYSLNDISKKFKEFSTHLKISGETANKIREVFVKIFSVFANLGNTVKSFLSYILPSADKVKVQIQTISSFIDVLVSKVKNLITSFQNRKTLGDYFRSEAEKAGSSLGPIQAGIDKLTALFNKFKEAVKGIFSKFNFFDLFKMDTEQASQQIISLLEKVVGVIQKVGSKIKELLAPVFKWLGESISKMDLYDLMAIIETGGLIAFLSNVNSQLKKLQKSGGLLKIFENFLNQVTGGGFSKFNKIAEDFSKNFGKISKSISDNTKILEKNFRVNAIKQIAIGIALLAGSFWLLSKIDVEDAIVAFAAITVLVGELVAAMAILSKLFSGPMADKGTFSAGMTSLVKIAGSVLILAIAFKALSSLSWQELLVGLSGFTAIMVELAVFVKVFSTMDSKFKGIKKVSKSLITLGIALNIIALAVKQFAHIDNIVQGLIGVTVIMGELLLFVRLLSNIDYSNAKSISKIATGLIKIGIALNIMALAVKQLGSLSVEELAKGLISIAVLLAETLIFMKVMAAGDDQSAVIKKAANALIKIGIALNIMALAVKQLAGLSVSELAKGLGSIAILLAEVYAFSYFMSKINTKDIYAASINLILFGAAFNIIAAAIKKLSALSLEQMLVSLVGLGAMLAAIVLTVQKLGKLDELELAIAAISLITIAASLKTMATALAEVGALNIPNMLVAVVALSAMLGVCYIIIKKLAEMSPQMTIQGISAIVTLAGSLDVVSRSVKRLASADIPGMIAATLSLSAILGALYLAALGFSTISGIGKVAASISALSIAIAIMAPALLLLSTISIGGAITALLTLAGVLVVMGVAANALAPVAPIMIAIAGALTLVGLAVGLAGAGILAIAVAMQMVSVVAVAFIQAITRIVVALAPLATVIGTAIAEIVTSFANVIAENAGIFVEFAKTIAMSFAEGIAAAVPGIVESAINLVTSFVEGIVQKAPDIIRAAIDLVKNFLTAIKDNIRNVVGLGIDIVLGLIEGIADKLPDIIQAGIDLMLSFIEGVAEGIENNTDRAIAAFDKLFMALFEAGKKWVLHFFDIGKNIIEGIKEGIHKAWERVKTAVTNVAQSILQIFKDIFKIQSPSKETDYDGKMLDYGLGDGVTNNADYPLGAASDLADGMSEELASINVEGPADAVELMSNNMCGSFEKADDAASEFTDRYNDGVSESFTEMTLKAKDGSMAIGEYGNKLGPVISKVDELRSRQNDASVAFQNGGMDLHTYQSIMDSTEAEIQELIGDVDKLKEALGFLRVQQAKNQKALNELDSAFKSGKINQGEYTASYNKLIAATQKTNKAIETFGFNVYDTGEKVDDASKKNDKYAKSASGAGGAAKNASKDIKNFGDDLEKTLEGQLKIFEEYKKDDPMNPDQIIKNMTDQINAMTGWATNMDKLAAMGIDKGLYEKLAEMGPEGSKYVEAFANMTADQLVKANELFQTSIQLPASVSKHLVDSFNSWGTGVVDGFTAGVKNPKSLAEMAEAVKQIPDQSKEIVAGGSGLDEHSPSKVMQQYGQWADDGFTRGIVNHQDNVYNTMKILVEHILKIVKEGLAPEKFQEIGVNVVDGLTKGLEDEAALARLKKVAEETSKIPEKVTRKKTKVESPSKVFYEIGKFLDLGLANGIHDYAGKVTESSEDMSNMAINSMRSAISQVSDFINNDLEDPVIRPVLDLSNVQHGARMLNSMLSTNKAYAISNSNGGLQNGNPIVGGTTFIQNNYSPKALSRADIYRQTRNQFSQYTNRYIQTGY